MGTMMTTVQVGVIWQIQCHDRLPIYFLTSRTTIPAIILDQFLNFTCVGLKFEKNTEIELKFDEVPWSKL